MAIKGTNHSRFLKENGQAVLAATAGLVMLGVGMLTSVSFFKSSSKSFRHFSQTTDWNLLKSEISAILANSDACKLSLTGSSFSVSNPAAQTISLKYNNATVYAVNGLFNQTLKITQLSLVPGVESPADTFQGTLTVQAQKQGGFYPPQNLSQTFRVNINTDAAGAIQGCNQSTSSGGGGGSGGTPGIVVSGSPAGAFWHYGSAGANCSDVCAFNGGTHNATITYVGSGGSDAQCNAVLTALGAAQTSITTGTSATSYCGFAPDNQLGCGLYEAAGPGTEKRYRCGAAVTTMTQSKTAFRRACACNS